MDFLPKVDEQAMLEAIGVSSVDELFADLPESVRRPIEGLPEGVSERELERELFRLLKTNQAAGEGPFFLGGGLYRHYIPAAVAALISRSEFYTAYTPYQAESSQGTLQGGFEFASAMVELTGMEVAAQPLYDGATAVAEAIRMAAGAHRKRSKFLVPKHLCRFQKGTLSNYTLGMELELVELPWAEKGGIDLPALESAVDADTIGLYWPMPDRFGVVDPNLMQVKEMLGKAHFIVAANPLALALYQPPGAWGADIVVGDVQPFGNAMNLGGPTAGYIATTKKLVRKLPGRLVGLTEDTSERRAFCLTLQTREQHIRRARATSNICTNEGLNALAATIHMALLGREGMRGMAIDSATRAKELAANLNDIPGVKAPYFPAPFFNEFVIGLDRPARKVAEELWAKGVNGGIPQEYEGLPNGLLVTSSECTTDGCVEALAEGLDEVLNGGGS